MTLILRCMLSYLILAVGPLTAKAQICSELFYQETQSDRDYVSFKNETIGSKRNVGIIKLLNRTFEPLITKLSQVTTRVDHPYVKKVLKALEENQPINNTDYKIISGRDNLFSIKLPVAIIPEQKNRMNLAYYNTVAAQEGVGRFAITGTGYIRNTKLLQPEGLGSRTQFLWVNYSIEKVQKYGLAHSILGSIITPVGDYGADFSKKLLRTTQIMIELAHENLDRESAKSYSENMLLLHGESGRAKRRDLEEVANFDQLPLSATIEGIISLHQLISAALSEKIPGVETGREALKEFVFNGASASGMTSELTARLPMGLIGPMTMSGTYFKNLFSKNISGQLEINEATKKMLKDFKEMHAKNRERRSCPMAFLFKTGKDLTNSHSPTDKSNTQTPLQTLAEDFFKIFTMVDN